MPFYFQGYSILSILLPGIWDTMFNFRDTAIFPPKYTNTKYININHLNFSTKEEKLYVHDMTSLSRPGLEVMKLEFILKLIIKHNDWLLADTCPQVANRCALF